MDANFVTNPLGADLDASGNNITDVAEPLSATGVATKGYVDVLTAPHFGSIITYAGNDFIRLQQDASLSRVDAVTFDTGQNQPHCAVTDNIYGYFGTFTSPGWVVKVDLSNLVWLAYMR